MANPSQAYGFRAVGLIDGSGSPTFGVFRSGTINPAAAQKIFYGDVALPLSGGFFAPATVTPGGAPVGGVFDGLFSWPSIAARMNVRQNWWTGVAGDVVGGGVVGCSVDVFPSIIFQVRSSGASGGPVLQTQVGQNINFTAGAGGNTLNGLSSYAADDSTIGNGPSLPFKIYGIVQAPESDPTSINNEILVIFNNLANA